MLLLLLQHVHVLSKRHHLSLRGDSLRLALNFTRRWLGLLQYLLPLGNLT